MRKTVDENNTENYPWLKAYPAAVDWHAPVAIRPVTEILDETCRRYAGRPAFDFLGRKWSWGDTGALVDRLAKGLQAQGIGKGMKVGIFLPNCFYFLVSYYAILRTGATVVNFNPLYAVPDLKHQIEDSQTDVMITVDLKALYGKLHPLLESTRLKKIVVGRFTDMLPFPKNALFGFLKRGDVADVAADVKADGGRVLWLRDLAANDGRFDPVAIDAHEDIAVLQYTGGTTGTPKAAMLTHANVSANVEQTARWFHAAKPGEERILGVLPFFHVFAMTAVMNLSVRYAFEIIALPRFDIDEALGVIDRKKPHYFPAVPAIYNAISHHKDVKKYDLHSLRYCISGGASLPVEVKKAFEAITGCVVVEGYGLSETSPVVCVNPIQGVNKAGSIGLPLPGTVVEIVDVEDKKTLKPVGEPGELCVRGPQVMRGYWNNKAETDLVMTEGRLHTGDVAQIDEDGYVYIVDRIKDVIITNGYNVYPRHVETAIYQHPEVEECIVAGQPDDARGEMVKAWIKPKAGSALTAETMKAFLKERLSPIEMPREIVIRTEPLPKTMVGKLSRKDLLAQEKEKAQQKKA